MKYSIILLSTLIALGAAQSSSTLRTTTRTTKLSTTKVSTTKTTKTTTAKKSTTTKTTTAKTTKATTTSNNPATTKIPASAGATAYPTARLITGEFDGGLLRYERERRESFEDLLG